MDDAQHQDFKAYEQVAPKIFPRGQLLRAWPLTGGVSATITALEILKPGCGVTKVIIRRHGDADLERNSHVAADEFRLLQALNSAGLAVPAPYCFDESGEILPTPYVVVEYVEGKTEIESPDPSGVAARMAAQLAAIHAVKGIVPDLSFLPGQRQRLAAWFEECPANPSPLFDERRIRETLKQVWPLPRVGRVLYCTGISGPETFCGRMAKSQPSSTGRTPKSGIPWGIWPTVASRSFGRSALKPCSSILAITSR